MNHKKIQTTVKTNGETSSLELGWVDSTHLDRDIEEERERFAKVARAGSRAVVAQPAIQTVEVAHLAPTIVAVYENGIVRVVTYVPERGKQ